MDVGIIGGYEIKGFTRIGRALRRKLMADNFARIVLSGKQIAPHLCWKSAAVINFQAAVRNCGEERNRRQHGIDDRQPFRAGNRLLDRRRQRGADDFRRRNLAAPETGSRGGIRSGDSAI